MLGWLGCGLGLALVGWFFWKRRKPVNHADQVWLEAKLLPDAQLDPNWRSLATYLGRFDLEAPAGPRASWSATGLRVAFEGTNLSIEFYRNNPEANSYFGVSIDGGPWQILKVDHDGRFALASDLALGTHLLELRRRDEGRSGEYQVLGLYLSGGRLLPAPEAAGLCLEFIGDSITCGYGNEAPTAESPFDTATENALLGYAALTAKALDAAFSLVSWSGSGVYRNYDGDTVNTLPSRYLRTLARLDQPVWEAKVQPEVVVINLGTNDFGPGVPDREAFVKAYQAFLANLRTRHPEAQLCCVIGPLLSGDKLAQAVSFIRDEVVAAARAAGDARVHFFAFTPEDGSLGFGANGHPSLARHRRMADELGAFLRAEVV